MEAATAVKPTAKQSMVLGLLAQDKTPKQIASRMKISVNGVYGHIRKMKDQGLLTEDGKPATPTSATPAADASSNGSSGDDKPAALAQVERLFEQGQDLAQARLTEINARTAEIDRERGSLIAEAEALQEVTGVTV